MQVHCSSLSQLEGARLSEGLNDPGLEFMRKSCVADALSLENPPTSYLTRLNSSRHLTHWCCVLRAVLSFKISVKNALLSFSFLSSSKLASLPQNGHRRESPSIGRPSRRDNLTSLGKGPLD
jgi:hypothetical protein